MPAGQPRSHIGPRALLPPPRETGLPRPRPSPCLPHLQGACLSVRPPEQLVALTRVALSRRAHAVRMLSRRCRPVVPPGPALRETEWSGAAHPARRRSARTPCPLAAPPTPSVTRWRPLPLPSEAPDALRHRSRTPCADPSPASAPGVEATAGRRRFHDSPTPRAAGTGAVGAAPPSPPPTPPRPAPLACPHRRPSSIARAARTSAHRGATGSGPACSAGTSRILLPIPRRTSAPAPTRAPVVAFRHRLGPQTGGLVATGRRRWRLPAGVGSPHGRRGGGLAWRGSSLGGENWADCEKQHVMYHTVWVIS